MIHKNAAHQRAKGCRVFAIFKAQAALLNQLEVEFVDDAGGLQKVFGAPRRETAHAIFLSCG